MTTAIHRAVERLRAGAHPGFVARLESGWAVMGDSQRLRGYMLLLPDPVVGSLNDLTGAARALYLSDMAWLGDAVIAVCRPRRVNYEILGNLEPALHAHVIPRYEAEPESVRTKAVWLYPPEEWNGPQWAFDPARDGALIEELRRALRGALPGGVKGGVPGGVK
ncbi:MAG TPA: hypothetical protein DEB06_01260, partial [Phycisphaerales bacterium]|nr:hypothetical protein [Phycisphaerales bacterium]